MPVGKRDSTRKMSSLEVEKMVEEKEKTKPIVSNRVGRFQISIWKKKRLIKAKNDFDVEREVETVRACIQYSRFQKIDRTWERQSIWCNCDELRNLAEVLDQFNHREEPPEKGGSGV